MENDRARYELKDVLGVTQLPEECDHWNGDIWDVAIELAKAGSLRAFLPSNKDHREFLVGHSSHDAGILSARFACLRDKQNARRDPLYETQLRLIGKLKAAIASSDGKREGEPVDVALERIVDEACVYCARIHNLLSTVPVARDRYQSHMSEAPSMESDYAATVKALSDAIQVLATEQKQTYASCNTLSNALAEVVKNRMKLEESRSK